MDFPELVRAELEKARRKHPNSHKSLHYFYGVILEEVDEFWEKVLEELVQFAAMCQRAAEDVLNQE